MLPGSKVVLKPEFDDPATFLALYLIKPETGKVYIVEDMQQGYIAGSSKHKTMGVFLEEIQNSPLPDGSFAFYNAVIFNEIQPPMHVQGQIDETIALPEEFLIVKEKELEEV